MKTSAIKSLEKQINAHLAAMPAEKRPETSSRSRVQSVAYAAGGSFEATDREGNTEMVVIETAKGWLK